MVLEFSVELIKSQENDYILVKSFIENLLSKMGSCNLSDQYLIWPVNNSPVMTSSVNNWPVNIWPVTIWPVKIMISSRYSYRPVTLTVPLPFLGLIKHRYLTVTLPLLTVTDRYWPLLTVTDRFWPLLTVTDRYSPLLTVTHRYSPFFSKRILNFQKNGEWR